MALTATANATQRREIFERLGMQRPLVCVSSVDRDNLALSVRPKTDTLASFVDDMQTKPVSTIIYTPTRKDVDAVTSLLSAQLPHVSIAGYHAGMSAGVCTWVFCATRLYM